jgi:DNA-damage-inducible protein J
MHKTATVNTRIDPLLKERAENILHQVGLSAAEAVRLFYTQICLHKGLPFEARIPNKASIQAMKDAANRKTKKASRIDDIFENL